MMEQRVTKTVIRRRAKSETAAPEPTPSPAPERQAASIPEVKAIPASPPVEPQHRPEPPARPPVETPPPPKVVAPPAPPPSSEPEEKESGYQGKYKRIKVVATPPPEPQAPAVTYTQTPGESKTDPSSPS